VPLVLQFLLGYLFTITLETAVLVVGLSRRHPVRRRVLAGVWLTACTYPVVWFVFPVLFDPSDTERRPMYLLVAETFAPAAECLIFLLAFVRRLPPKELATVQDVVAITVANLVSFGAGELLYWVLAAIDRSP
jgi:hypothetical protein